MNFQDFVIKGKKSLERKKKHRKNIVDFTIISFTFKMNPVEPISDPCGTPHSISDFSERTLFNFVNCFLEV